MKTQLQPLHRTIGEHFRGKPEIVELVLTALLARGHILIEDVPGVGKTTLAYVLAKALRQQVSRIQFTSDLLPSDILGVSVFEGPGNGFRFHPGPIFADIVLADEINRAAPRTQSALLEAMERGMITVDGETHKLSRHFFVFATQNPVDRESTFPLPEAQLNRFALRLTLGYPPREAELNLMRRAPARYDEMHPRNAFDWSLIADLQEDVAQVFIEDSLLEYIYTLVQSTRADQRLLVGISPRGASVSCHLLRAHAVVAGRNFVSPDDVHALALSALAHRLISPRLVRRSSHHSSNGIARLGARRNRSGDRRPPDHPRTHPDAGHIRPRPSRKF